MTIDVQAQIREAQARLDAWKAEHGQWVTGMKPVIVLPLDFLRALDRLDDARRVEGLAERVWLQAKRETAAAHAAAHRIAPPDLCNAVPGHRWLDVTEWRRKGCPQ